MKRAFILSTDAVIAAAFVAVLVGSMAALAQSTPADTHAGNQALARDYLYLKHAKKMSTLTPDFVQSRTGRTLQETLPSTSDSSPWSHADIYVPPRFLNCPEVGSCTITEDAAIAGNWFGSLNNYVGSQDAFNSLQSIPYYREAWVKP